MKKFLSILSIIFCGFLVVGCDGNKKNETNFNEHLIEVRNNLFAGEDKTYYVTLCTGEREKDYALDGAVNELIPFGIVTLARLDNELLKQDTYPFTLVVNGENITGSLEKSPYDNTYSADIGKSIIDDAEITFQLVIDGTNFSQKLDNISCEQLNYSIKNLSKERGNLSEAFIKILKDYSGESNRYYWYVGIISPEGKTSGILIDATSGDIISKKI